MVRLAVRSSVRLILRSANAELQPAGMHPRPKRLMAANVISTIKSKVNVSRKCVAIIFFVLIGRPVRIEARPVDGETGGDVTDIHKCFLFEK